MISRVFNEIDQLKFAELSGDSNPLHLDPLTTRRMQYGAPVVHGIHLVLWCLEDFARLHGSRFNLDEIKVSFHEALTIGDSAEIKVENKSIYEVWARGLRCVRIQFKYHNAQNPHSEVKTSLINREQISCNDLSFVEASQKTGKTTINVNCATLVKLFPNLSKLNSSWQIEVLLATTRIVGMLCPGKNSIYAGLDLNFTSINENDSIQHRDLNFTVVRSDERFMAIWMDVEANGVTGRIKTYYRHPIVEQSTLSNVKHLVKQGEFKSHRALIVGGSRGLGELTAKIIGTGGGQLLLTYHKGQADAKRLANEMVNEKLSAETFNLDVTESYERLVEKLLIGFGNNRDITHLYYYATPWISKGQYGVFSSEKYLKFSNYYVSGFFNLIRALCHIGCKDYQIFYPSSEYVSVLPEFFVEYTTAKIAGESICRQITSHFPVKRPHFPRLPALLTDQSVGNIAVKKNNSLEIILNEIRMMQVN